MIANNDLARVFLFPNGVNRCNVRPVYGDCFAVDALTQDGGDVTDVECPDPRQYGKFKKIGSIRGEVGRLTTSLQRRLTLEEKAILRGIFDDGCGLDLHIHWGSCTDPTAFNQYIKAWVLENVVSTSWSTDPVIALQSGDRAAVNESMDISAQSFFEVMATLRYSQRAAALTTVPILSIAICDNKSCGGDACAPSGGCDKLYALDNAGDVLVSLDSGATWVKVDITAVSGTPAPVAAACVGPNLVIVYASGAIGYLPRNDVDRNVLTAWTVTTGVIPSGAGAPVVVYGVSTIFGPAILVGTANGHVYQIDAGLTSELVDDSSAAGNQINGIASNGDVTLYVGEAGTVLVQRSGSDLVASVLDNPTTSDLFAAVVKTANNWLVGGASGEMWCTNDAGCTWSQVNVSGLSTNPITDLCASNRHVIWMAGGGDIWRSIDGGSTWVSEPNDANVACRVAAAALGTITKVACCNYDPNRIVGIGTTGVLDANGIIVVGE